MTTDEPILEIKGLCKSYRRAGDRFIAVRDISLSLSASEILGIVGESGCGKSTLAFCILRLTGTDSGEIIWHGSPGDSVDLASLKEREMRRLRPQIQTVFQNPYASFNPAFTVGKALSHVGRLYRMKPEEYEAKISELLGCCGIDKELLERQPSQLSGGQLQRLAIVRALLPSPRLLIADEAVSALDVSVQESIIELLDSLSKRFKIAVIFISHDLAAVKSLCGRVMVMYRGSIVEEGRTGEIFADPAHPYTKALLSARPRLDKSKATEERILLKGDVTAAPGDIAGCPFAGRCYLDKADDCFNCRPEPVNISESHSAACFLIGGKGG